MYFMIFNPASLLSHAAGPPVNCEYSAFGPWSECSRRCGGGFRSRERNIQILARRGGKPCRGGSRETQICNQQSCPRKNARNLTAFVRLSARPSVRPRCSVFNPQSIYPAFSLQPSAFFSVLVHPAFRALCSHLLLLTAHPSDPLEPPGPNQRHVHPFTLDLSTSNLDSHTLAHPYSYVHIYVVKGCENAFL